nr:unnamed protein product [Digitaria exilis]
MFSSPKILVSTPDACRQVLMDVEGFINGWPKAMVALTGPKSFVAIGYEEHHRLRKLITAPINVFDALTSYLPFIDRTIRSSLKTWSDVSVDAGCEVEFLIELQRMMFKIIVQIFLGCADDATMHATKHNNDHRKKCRAERREAGLNNLEVVSDHSHICNKTWGPRSRTWMRKGSTEPATGEDATLDCIKARGTAV